MTDDKTRVILHAEDEPAHATIIHMAFQRTVGNVQLMQVEDGREALDYLYHRGSFEVPVLSPRPDLILLDLHMPQFSGLEVLAIVKKDPGLQTIPVIVLTTSDLAEDRAAARTYGVDEYLVKPDGFDKFVTMISELCKAWL